MPELALERPATGHVMTTLLLPALLPGAETTWFVKPMLKLSPPRDVQALPPGNGQGTVDPH